jgi:RNA polymerase sigma-70 factor (ECF subfamily)
MALNERKLVRRLRKRDETAFTDLVRNYQHKVFNIVYRIVGDRSEAEEVSQEVFVTVFKHIDGFRGDAKFSTWLYRIATNHARNRVKYLARRSQRAHQALEDTSDKAINDGAGGDRLAGPHEAAIGNELEEIIRDGLAFLNEMHRTIVVLRDIEHLTYAEIAEVVELPEGTVKSRLYRARVALKEYVESRYNGEK